MRELRAKMCQGVTFVLRWGALAACVLLTAPRVAHACSGRFIGVGWYIAETWPADGETAMPTDGVIALRMAPWGPGVPGQGAWPNPDDAALVLNVTTADGKTVNGQNEAFGNVTLWRPVRPLAAGARYVLNAELRSPLMLPADAPGSQQLTLEFSTEQAVSAPMAFDDPKVEFEAFEAEVNECNDGTRVLPPAHDPPVLRHHQPTHDCDGWASGCEPVDPQRAALARVDVGPITGGQPNAGHLVRAVVSVGKPYSFDAPAVEGVEVASEVETYVPPGGSQIFHLLLPKRDRDYQACVQLRATDADGRAHDWQGPCTSRAAILGADDGTKTPASAEEPKPASNGCSVAGPGQLPKSQPSPAWYCFMMFLAIRILWTSSGPSARRKVRAP